MTADPKRSPPQFTFIRIIFLIFGGLLALVSGGCGMMFLSAGVRDWQMLIFLGIPFAFGVLVMLLAAGAGGSSSGPPLDD